MALASRNTTSRLITSGVSSDNRWSRHACQPERGVRGTLRSLK